MTALEWTRTYGPLITLIAVVVNTVAVGWLVFLERATHRLQKAFEDDRKRVDVFLRISDMPGSAGVRPRVDVRLYNLSERGIFWRSVTATASAEGLGEVTVNHTIEKIIPAYRDDGFDVGPGIAIKARILCGRGDMRYYKWRVEAKCIFFAHGQERETVGIEGVESLDLPGDFSV